jgi:hypothetical protein
MTDTNKKDNTETDVEMLALLVVNGFAEMKQLMNNMGSEIRTEMHEEFEDVRGEMRAGFENNRIEHKEMNEHLASLDRKQMGARESLDETVLKSEFDELSERVVVLETKLA